MRVVPCVDVISFYRTSLVIRRLPVLGLTSSSYCKVINVSAKGGAGLYGVAGRRKTLYLARGLRGLRGPELDVPHKVF